jgi:mannan endo-1,4-beta-mannosidase
MFQNIMKYSFHTLLSPVLCLLASAISCSALEPANRNANEKARVLLNYVEGLGARKEKRLLSGQFVDFGEGASLRLPGEIQAATGKCPALLGVDYADFPKGSVTTSNCNRAVMEYWKQGGLVTVGVHLYNPANPKGGGLRDKGVDLTTLLSEGDTHDRWMRQLDLLAAGLQELKDAGVVVLWRPFHEMNGGWFWWGAQPPDQFIRVWQHMFDYFTNTKKLDNLLWVYGPNHGQKTAAYYAGDRYVDIVGLDAYTDFIDPEHIRGYPEVAALPKPFGFTEFGPHGSQNPPGDYDYPRFIKGIESHFAKAVFFMSWNGKWSLARNNNVKELLAHPWIVNRDDLPPDLMRKLRD